MLAPERQRSFECVVNGPAERVQPVVGGRRLDAVNFACLGNRHAATINFDDTASSLVSMEKCCG